MNQSTALRTLLNYTSRSYPGWITLLVAEKESHFLLNLISEEFAVNSIELHKIQDNDKTHLKKHSQIVAESVKVSLDATQMRDQASKCQKTTPLAYGAPYLIH